MAENHLTEWKHEGKYFHEREGVPLPYLVFDLLDAVLHPGPEPDQFTGTTPEVRTQKFGNDSLQCIMLSKSMKPQPGTFPPTVPLGVFPTYCLFPQSDRLEVSYSLGEQTVQRTVLGKFADQEVTVGLRISEGATPLAEAKVLTLSTYTAAEGEFTPPAGLTGATSRIPLVPNAAIRATKTSGAPPQYPVNARMAHVSGSVVLHVIVGTDGRVAHLTVLSAPDPELAISSLQAVRTWTYKPYLLNGEPTPIDTTITVNFNISSG